MLSPERLDILQTQWVRLFSSFPIEIANLYPVFDQLVQLYSEPHRHYHTLEHIAEMLKVAGRLGSQAQDPLAISLAVWFHDAIYDPRASDNEARSAGLARTELGNLGIPADRVERIARLIQATRHEEATSLDADTAVILDADLAILGAGEPRYNRYASDIRKEYAHVPEEEYRRGRARVLESFLQRPRIYRTETMFTEAEAAARKNMTRELAQLQ